MSCDAKAKPRSANSTAATINATEVATGLGGTIAPDANGFKVTVGGATAAFGTDSRYGVVRDDLIEMHAGSWTGRPLARLRSTKAWREVQASPSPLQLPPAHPAPSRARRPARRETRRSRPTRRRT